MQINQYEKLIIKQRFEGFELLGYETRNKYEVLDEQNNKVAFAAEQGKGIFSFISRQFLGHWRNFEVHFFNENKDEFLIAKHPFRFYFERLDIHEDNGALIGSLERKFSLLSKKFDVMNERGEVIYKMRSPIWKIWTFPFFKNGREVASIQKKWSGLLTEAFTDKDTFLVDFGKESLSTNDKLIMLAASVFIDLRFFENKANQ
jgi:uncharacterized protein YxjI